MNTGRRRKMKMSGWWGGGVFWRVRSDHKKKKKRGWKLKNNYNKTALAVSELGAKRWASSLIWLP